MVDKLLRAKNDHDLDALVACFAEDYVNETPSHPARGFQGREQVRRNWEQIFAFLPDLRAAVPRRSIEGGTARTEWGMTGTRRTGTGHHTPSAPAFGIRALVLPRPPSHPLPSTH